MDKQYIILEYSKPVVIVDDLQVAIQMVRNLESRRPAGSLSGFTIQEHIEEHD